MELTKGQIIGKFAKKCENCLRNTLLSYEIEFTCVACGYNK